MATVVAISGSLRKGSFNSALLRAAAELAPDDLVLVEGSIAAIPLYDGDLEAREGLPPAVVELKAQIAAADGLLLATPEYNQSFPGVLKNAIDWLSRPPADVPRVFGGKAVAVIGATPGPGGTRLAQAAWLPVLRALGTRPWFGKQLHVSGAASLFDGEGGLVDERTRAQLAEYLRGFARFVASPSG
ncbi:MAG: NAD(P)H-dependent oxidoreductase [Myxococcota bacterium]|nr:NAD(P)H-dependent oxidoreductase [Myxococcota bacterium]MDW8361662.1 NADPH-dependent FMN reductase [Myxococcales bacterium]